MDILCLEASRKKQMIEKKITRLSEKYSIREIFYPIWLLDVEVSMYFFSSRIKNARMNAGIDGLCGDVSFMSDRVGVCEVEADPKQLISPTSQMDEKGLSKVKDSLLPFILPKARSIFVRPSINILNNKIIYKQFYRLSNKDETGQIIFIDKSDGKIAAFNGGTS